MSKTMLTRAKLATTKHKEQVHVLRLRKQLQQQREHKVQKSITCAAGGGALPVTIVASAEKK
jgi:hypothetical protein